MLCESNVHFYTILTLEIPYRLKRVVHQLADVIPYDGKLFLVLISEENENNLVIIQQVHGGVRSKYASATEEQLYAVAGLYFQRMGERG